MGQVLKCGICFEPIADVRPGKEVFAHLIIGSCCKHLYEKKKEK